ncbi:monofunctional biosynthetic peptidoglycan transglycosylase [Longimicrobium sp.]|uniref:monofunctional biosynthetic peptidoglycan transglycosylase n=1 Tax=Longimicrobium sp. TaxID=2029185 RepID=UPI002C89EE3A|nr:monofunctional biosynthetic peptidoglycan transglycosylase [Longimicrobium sp.]HSU16550.1 monofunctional biosynthetic peptidoglycan transglycosylase [Longimicrobium sp.]
MRFRRPPPIEPGDDATLPYEPAEPRPRRRRLAVRLAFWVGKVLAGYYVLCLLLLVVYRFVPPPATGVGLQRRLEAWAGGRDLAERREYRPLAEISPHLPRAVVAAEDGRFWTHHGFDWVEMRRARRDATGGGRVRGASTITQQLMKNLFGCACRNPLRKVYDLALTPAAELILGKRRILELYLNHVEWGDGVFGAEAAARHHYHVGARELSRTQSAGLAALLPNPHQRTTGNTPAYRQQILERMRARGW